MQVFRLDLVGLTDVNGSDDGIFELAHIPRPIELHQRREGGVGQPLWPPGAVRVPGQEVRGEIGDVTLAFPQRRKLDREQAQAIE